MNKPQALADPLLRIPPHNLEAEQAALGCCLLDAQGEAMGKCVDALEPLAFYDLRHQTLFAAIKAVWDDNQPIDLITVSQKLRDTQQIDEVGGLGYLSSLQDATPGPASVGNYIAILRDYWMLRRIQAIGSELTSKVHETPPTEAAALLEEAEKTILGVSIGAKSQKMTPMKDLVRGCVDQLSEWHDRKEGVIGVPTGFVELDRMTCGLQPGDMIVLAARPSMGKTALAMNIAVHAAMRVGIDVGVFSLEMSARSLCMRLIYSEASLSSRAAQEGFMSEGDFRRVTLAAGKLAKSRLHIDDSSGLTISQIRSRARRMFSEHNCRLFVIDYLQLIASQQRRGHHNREVEVAEMSRGVKAIAKELNVPVIILCQLNRQIEQGAPRKPRLSDLRESGSIEQDADVVGMLYRAENDEDGIEEKTAIPVNLSIAKQRNGPTGEVFLTFLKSFTRFESASKINP